MSHIIIKRDTIGHTWLLAKFTEDATWDVSQHEKNSTEACRHCSVKTSIGTLTSYERLDAPNSILTLHASGFNIFHNS